MILLLATIALAGEPSLDGAGTAVRPHTAETPEKGEVLVRLPTGRSQVGLTDHDAVFIAPFDLTIGGPRLGWEHGGQLGGTRWALVPSLGVDTSLKRGSARLEALGSWDLGVHQISAELAFDARIVRQTAIDAEISHPTRFDRLQSHALAVWDTPWTRVKVRLPLRDRGKSLAWGSGSVAWTFTSERVHLAAGVGLMLGHPTDRWTLGEYRWWFVQPYPELDLVVRF